MHMWLDLWKLIQMAQNLKSILLLDLKPLLLHYLVTPNTCIIDGQVCFHRWPFAVPFKPPRCTTESLGPVNGINKDVSSARLLVTTVSTYPVDWVCFCHWLKTQHCFLWPNGRYSPPVATHLLHTSRRDSQWIKCFKLVILEIRNVRFGSIFLKPVTYTHGFQV